jgi:hypothetical protein
MRISTFFLILIWILNYFHAVAQSPNQPWLIGTNDFPGVEGYGNYILRFQGDSVALESANLKMNFETTMAAVADSSGQLLFYTNGCYIATADGDTMLLGESLNPGDIAEWVCPGSGYISPRGATILQVPGSEHLYYLIHMAVRYEENKRLEFGPLYYSAIDMSLENGKGAVVAKNIPLLGGNLEPYSIVRHGNGRDWWILVAEYGTSRYHRLLLSPEGITVNGVQNIGPKLGCRHTGTTSFSPDGRRYGRFHDCRLAVFDFERCTGLLSMPRDIYLPPKSFGGGGMAFSPDGDRLLINTQMAVMKADLTAPALQLDTVVSWLKILGASLGHMQYTPDGRIFISNMSRAQYFHVLENPNAPDTTIGFQFRGQVLPVWSVRTLPNLPNFNLLDLSDSPCDTLGITTTAVPALPGYVELSPNPATDHIRVRYETDMPLTLSIYDARGVLMQTKQSETGDTQSIFEVKNWPRGMYAMVVTAKGYSSKTIRFVLH